MSRIMIRFLCVALVSLATTSSAFATIISGPIINPANGNSYYLLEAATWPASQAEAVTLGGNLVTINDQAEQDWLISEFGPIDSDFSPNSFWIGLNDTAEEGSFVWASGEISGYINWFPGEPSAGAGPNEDYVYVGRYANGQWNDSTETAGSNQQPLPRGVIEVVVPEPTSALLVALGSLAALRRR